MNDLTLIIKPALTFVLVIAGAATAWAHPAWGIVQDRQGNDAGRVATVAQSAAPWAPSGGLIDRDGTLWILEYDTRNAQRVRRIDGAGQERVFAAAVSRSPEHES